MPDWPFPVRLCRTGPYSAWLSVSCACLPSSLPIGLTPCFPFIPVSSFLPLFLLCLLGFRFFPYLFFASYCSYNTQRTNAARLCITLLFRVELVKSPLLFLPFGFCLIPCCEYHQLRHVISVARVPTLEYLPQLSSQEYFPPSACVRTLPHQFLLHRDPPLPCAFRSAPYSLSSSNFRLCVLAPFRPIMVSSGPTH